jgi:EpsI family protein
MIVNQECSGLKLLVSLMMFAGFLGLTHAGAWWKKAALLLYSLPLACAVNATRIAASGVLGECVSPRTGDLFHDYSGIYVWLTAILGFCVAVRVTRLQFAVVAAHSAARTPHGAQRHPRAAFLVMLALLAAGGALTRAGAGKGLREVSTGLALPRGDLPTRLGAWTSQAVVFSPVTYEFYAGSHIASRRYRRTDGTVIDVMLVATHQRHQVHTPVPCYECEGGVIRASRSTELALAGRRVPVQRLWVRRGAWNEECVYWFQSGARAASDPVAIKAISAGRLLLGQIREPILCYQFACPTHGAVPNPALDPFIREFMSFAGAIVRKDDEHVRSERRRR